MDVDGHGVVWIYAVMLTTCLLTRQATAQNACASSSLYEGEGNAATVSSECFSNGTVHYRWSSNPEVWFLWLDYSCIGPDGSEFHPETPPLNQADGDFLQGTAVASIPTWSDGWNCSFFGCYEVGSRRTFLYGIAPTPCTVVSVAVTSIEATVTSIEATVTSTVAVTLTSSSQVLHTTPSVAPPTTPLPRPVGDQELNPVVIAVPIGLAVVVAIPMVAILSIILIKCLPYTKRRNPEPPFISDPPSELMPDPEFFSKELSPPVSEQSVFSPLDNINDLVIIYDKSPSVQKTHRTTTPHAILSGDAHTGSLPTIQELEADTTSTGSHLHCFPPWNYLSTSSPELNGSGIDSILGKERDSSFGDIPTVDDDRCSMATETASVESSVNITGSTMLERSSSLTQTNCDDTRDSSTISNGYVHLNQTTTSTQPLALYDVTTTPTNLLQLSKGLTHESEGIAVISATPELTHSTQSTGRQCLAGSATYEEISLVLEPSEESHRETHYSTPPGYIANCDSGISG